MMLSYIHSKLDPSNIFSLSSLTSTYSMYTNLMLHVGSRRPCIWRAEMNRRWSWNEEQSVVKWMPMRCSIFQHCVTATGHILIGRPIALRRSVFHAPRPLISLFIFYTTALQLYLVHFGAQDFFTESCELKCHPSILYGRKWPYNWYRLQRLLNYVQGHTQRNASTNSTY